MQRPFRLVLSAIALAALVGCGKATPVAQPPVIDSVFTRMPSANAKQSIGVQQQDRRDGTIRSPETGTGGAWAIAK